MEDTASTSVAVQISDAAGLRARGLDTRLISRRVTDAYLMQVLRHGFLHSGERLVSTATTPWGLQIFLVADISCWPMTHQ